MNRESVSKSGSLSTSARPLTITLGYSVGIKGAHNTPFYAEADDRLVVHWLPFMVDQAFIRLHGCGCLVGESHTHRPWSTQRLQDASYESVGQLWRGSQTACGRAHPYKLRWDSPSAAYNAHTSTGGGGPVGACRATP